MTNPTTPLLYEHEDGRYAVNPDTSGDPGWHRLGPVDVSALAAPVQAVPATQVADSDDLRAVEIAGLESSCAHLARLVDELRPDSDRLEYLLRRLSGSALRAYLGVANDTGDLQELRTLIDAHRGAPAALATPWKDHMTAQLVNELVDVAKKFHGAQQLRERIANVVRPLADRAKGGAA